MRIMASLFTAGLLVSAFTGGPVVVAEPREEDEQLEEEVAALVDEIDSAWVVY